MWARWELSVLSSTQALIHKLCSYECVAHWQQLEASVCRSLYERGCLNHYWQPRCPFECENEPSADGWILVQAVKASGSKLMSKRLLKQIKMRIRNSLLIHENKMKNLNNFSRFKFKCGDHREGITTDLNPVMSQVLRYTSDRVQRSQGHPGFHHTVYWLWAAQCLWNVRGAGGVEGAAGLKQAAGKINSLWKHCWLLHFVFNTHNHRSLTFRRLTKTYFDILPEMNDFELSF